MANPLTLWLSETAVGRFAAWMHERTFSGWSWGSRMVISALWDFIDTATRILFLPFYLVVPGLALFVRTPLDFILAFFGMMLWGTPGLLQSTEFVFGVVPGFGWVFDLLPMLSITGFIVRKQERAKETGIDESEREEYVFDEGAEDAQEFGPEIGEKNFSGRRGSMAGFLMG
ncbi:MAG: hypothetical protein Q8Q97_02810, partial [bacterium]|nr:hypothetical protein [bacterium]